MNTQIKGWLLCFFAISVAACGNSGSGGTADGGNQISMARISSANAKQLGTAAAEGLKQTTLNDTSSAIGFRPAARGIGILSNQISASFADKTSNARVPGLNCGLGSADETANPDGGKTIVFTNCDLLGLGLLEINGTIITSSDTSGDTTTVSIEYVNFTLDDGTNVVVVDMKASCTTDTTTLETSCSFADVTGFDGRTYIFSDAIISGDAATGYIVSATISDPDHGNFSIVTTNPILFGCTNGQPSSGQIQFTDDAGVLVTVTFNDCASFTVSYSGTSEVYFW